MSKLSMSLRGLDSTLKQLAKYREGLNGAHDEGVKAMATTVRNAARSALRQPGTGLLYPSRVGRAHRKQLERYEHVKAEHDESTSQGREIRRNSRKYLRTTERRLAKTLKRLQKQAPGKLHQASRVGEAPAPDVGLLPQAVKAGVLDGVRVVGVGGDWGGWVALHEGRGRQKGPRPFLRMALDRVKNVLNDVMVSEIRKRGYGG